MDKKETAPKAQTPNHFINVITGFNTDIEYQGVVYHVQTEDKGLDSPLILSLVYAGGAILASKRSPYEDLIAAGFNEEVLTQRLQRQHRLICAAINAGRLEELKRMGGKQPTEVLPVEVTEKGVELFFTPVVEADLTAETKPTEVSEPVQGSLDEVTIEEPGPTQAEKVSSSPASAYTVHDSRRQASSNVVQAESGVTLTILNDEEFRAGESFTIRVLLEDNSGNKQKSLAGVPVSVKILGTAFRPQIYTIKTERDGVAIVQATMPGDRKSTR